MKTLKQLLEKSTASQGYQPKPKDEKRFVDKHVVLKQADANGNKDDVFNATNVKEVEREKERHGYSAGQDEAVYESAASIEEKLGANATAGEYIHDFQKSTDPRFKGDSQAKRRERALAAFMGAKKGMKEETEQLSEGEVAHAQYCKYCDSAKDMLGKIAKGIDTHQKHITDKNNFNGGQAHWGHVEDMKGFHRQIQDLHDRVLQTGEYAAPPKPKAIKEEAEQDTNEDQIVEFMNSFYELLDEDNKKIFEELTKEQDVEQVLQMIDEVLNGEESNG